jgi:hypothetical protein
MVISTTRSVRIAAEIPQRETEFRQPGVFSYFDAVTEHTDGHFVMLGVQRYCRSQWPRSLKHEMPSPA